MTKTEVIQSMQAALSPGTNITASIHQGVEESIINFAAGQWLTGDLKMIDCTNAYIELHFITQGANWGKGKVGGDREGWAICNGNNNTMNRTGRVPMGWGTAGYDGNGSIAQPNMKTPSGGSVDYGNNAESLSVTQIPTHYHYFPGDDGLNKDSGNWTSRYDGNFAYDANSNNSSGSGKVYKTTNTGGGDKHNNVQPSMVTLFIQKIDDV